MNVSIAGGGISGLTTAFYLSQMPRIGSITVHEASERLGGWIQTTKDCGVIFEHGPRTIRPVGRQGANTLELVEQLGLSKKINPIITGHPATVNRMVYVDGQLCKLPSDLKSLFTRQKPFTKPLVFAGIKEFFTPQKKITDDESLFDFVERRFGHEVAKYAIDPMVRGICAGDARSISAKSFVAGPLFHLEQEYGSIFRGLVKRKLKGQSPKIYSSNSVGSNYCSRIFGHHLAKLGLIFSEFSHSQPLVQRARGEKWNVWTIEGGLETIITTLKERLERDGVQIQMSSPISEDVLNRSSFTFYTTPAFVTAQCVSQHDLGQHLRSIPYVDVAVINVMFNGTHHVSNPGFGFLVPSSEKNMPILGVIFDTCSFPQRDCTIFTVMMGGAWFQQLFGTQPSLEHLESVAVQNLKKIMKIDESPLKVVGKIHANCIAQYTVGHAQRVQKMRQMIQKAKLPISLVGSSYDGVGINDAIMSSKVQVDKFISEQC